MIFNITETKEIYDIGTMHDILYYKEKNLNNYVYLYSLYFKSN